MSRTAASFSVSDIQALILKVPIDQLPKVALAVTDAINTAAAADVRAYIAELEAMPIDETDEWAITTRENPEGLEALYAKAMASGPAEDMAAGFARRAHLFPA